VLITRGRAGSGIGSSEVATLYTDASGKTEYNTKDADEDYMYYAEAYKDTYFDTHTQQVSVTRGEKNFSTTIYMYAYSYVKLHVKNVNPFNQFDVINIKSFCGSKDIVGATVDTTLLWCVDCDCKWFGNYYYEYSLGITRNNITQKIYFSFTTVALDTIIVDLNY
jgi:hypothetical protein